MVLLTAQKCIIATGATQHSPLRPETSTSRADYKGALRHVQNGIAKASSVLIVGGGAVGVEVAGVRTPDNYLAPRDSLTLVGSHITLSWHIRDYGTWPLAPA